MSFYMYSGIGAALYAVYASLKYYSLTGEGLVDASKVKSMNIDHIIDVRTQMEWNMGHHKNAKHLPINKISKSSLNNLNIKTGDSIVVYCNTGQRARKAAEMIRKLGYTKVYYIESGWNSLK